MGLRGIIKAAALCAIFTLVTPLAAQPIVNFIPQVHRNPFIYKEFDDRVAESQFEVLRALSKLRGATVFHEGLTKNPPPDKRVSIYSEALGPVLPVQEFYGEDKYFMRKRYSELTRAQKVLLFEEGGARLAIDLGIIKQLRAVDSPEEHNRDLNWTEDNFMRIRNQPDRETAIVEFVNSPEFQARGVKRRELEALNRIRDFVASSEYQGEPLAIVYGGYHQFNEASKFQESFEFNYTRACEASVIHLPDQSLRKLNMGPVRYK